MGGPRAGPPFLLPLAGWLRPKATGLMAVCGHFPVDEPVLGVVVGFQNRGQGFEH